MTTQFNPMTNGTYGFGGFGNPGSFTPTGFGGNAFSGQPGFGFWNPSFFFGPTPAGAPFFNYPWQAWSGIPGPSPAFGPAAPWNGTGTPFGGWDGRGFGPFAGDSSHGFGGGTPGFAATSQGWNAPHPFTPWGANWAPTSFFGSNAWPTPWAAAGNFFNGFFPFAAPTPWFLNPAGSRGFNPATFGGPSASTGSRPAAQHAAETNGCCGGIGINRDAA